MTHQLLIRENKPYVVYTYTETDEPIWHKLWWPIRGTAHSVRMYGLEGAWLRSAGSGWSNHGYKAESQPGVLIELLKLKSKLARPFGVFGDCVEIKGLMAELVLPPGRNPGVYMGN